mgnify:CR=1 FL=1
MNDTHSTAEMEDYLAAGESRPWYKKRWVWIVAILLLLGIIAFVMTSRGEEKPSYITNAVERGTLDLTVTATGNLRPTNQVEVGSEISGRIDDVLVDVNDAVTRGQILAVINTEVIEDQITQARAQLNSARASVLQARATLEVNTAQLNRLKEVQQLSGGKVPSQIEMEAAEATVRRDEAALTSAQASVSSAQAQLSSSQVSFDRAVIRSPVAGVVLARQVEPGQTVVAAFNTPTLFVLAEDLGTMQLRIEVDEADVGQVAPGQDASFTVDAYPGRRFPAAVERVDLASNTTSLTEQQQQSQGGNQVVSYEARLRVSNGEGLLRPGMTATATISTDSTANQLLVPNAALRFDPGELPEEEGGMFGPQSFGLDREEDEATIGIGSRQTVYVVDEDGNPEAIEVITGPSDGRLTTITSGELDAGMEVIVGEGAAQQ